jgi:hypothetical protein
MSSTEFEKEMIDRMARMETRNEIVLETLDALREDVRQSARAAKKEIEVVEKRVEKVEKAQHSTKLRLKILFSGATLIATYLGFPKIGELFK